MKILWNIWIHLGSIACSIVAIVILVGLRDVEADEATLANLWKMGEAFLFLLLMIMYEVNVAQQDIKKQAA